MTQVDHLARGLLTDLYIGGQAMPLYLAVSW
jgi:hypothetical protein